MISNNLLNIILGLQIGAYCLALLFPTYCTSGGCPGYLDGLACAIFGIFGFLVSPILGVWFANPILIFGLIFRNNLPVFSLLCNLAAVCICSILLNGGEVLLNEAGHIGYITELKLGYWLWLSSAIFALVHSILKNIQNIQKNALGRKKLREEIETNSFSQ